MKKVRIFRAWFSQKWGFILPSSARVSRLTHQTVICVRYPELVKSTPGGWHYGRYVSTEATSQGGFLPVLWDVPKSQMHGVSDIGALVEWLQEHVTFGQESTNNLAVLHNQNNMVRDFGMSAWVSPRSRSFLFPWWSCFECLAAPRVRHSTAFLSGL